MFRDEKQGVIEYSFNPKPNFVKKLAFSLLDLTENVPARHPTGFPRSHHKCFKGVHRVKHIYSVRKTSHDAFLCLSC